MRGSERGFVIWTIAYMAIYMLLFLTGCFMSIPVPNATPPSWFTPVFFALHTLCMVQNFVAFGLTIRDLYLRPFPHPNDKLTWSLLLFWTGGIGWLFYVFRHAIHRRLPGDENGLVLQRVPTDN